MGIKHDITINGRTIAVEDGALLLDAALENGIQLQHQCRSGLCGTCRIDVISGTLEGGNSSEPGVVYACQSRIKGTVALEQKQAPQRREIKGCIKVLRPLSSDVLELGVKPHGIMPYHPGQYALLQFSGYPSRPFSYTYPVLSKPDPRLLWFHVRQFAQGTVTAALGRRITSGHQLTIAGPYGNAHFQAHQTNRLILVATNTGFAPIWAIAAAALREDPYRNIVVIVGGRSIHALYMTPVLDRLARFPNVRIIATCSGSTRRPSNIRVGRPTDYLPSLVAGDIVYACGAPAMVDQVRQIAASAGISCHADPFQLAQQKGAYDNIVERTISWLRQPIRTSAR